MGTTYEHTQLAAVQDNGDVKVLYPINTASDVSVDKTNPAIPSSVENVQNLVDKVKTMAFNDGKDVVFFSDSSEASAQNVSSEIDDSKLSVVTTWSSNKIVDATNSFKKGYEMTASDINKLFISPVIMNVDGRDAVIGNSAPEEGRQWIVEYFPMVASNVSVSGNVGDPNTIRTAIQRWTGINYNATEDMDDVVVYERVCIQGTWKNFVKIR